MGAHPIRPWNDWYHVMGHTYGTWLPGDPRGFRTRHHREDCPYDYKSPPPQGAYAARHRHAKSLMKRPPVNLSIEQRHAAAEELWKSLHRRRIDLVILSVDRVHYHALARFPDHDPRHWIGIAKKESSHYLKEAALAPAGGLWAVRCQCRPIADRSHQIRVFHYIADHAKNGASIRRMTRPELPGS